MPAETARHERTVMCWPTRIDLYGELMPAARLAHAEVAMTIARYEPVTMIARPGEGDAAEAACGPEVEVVELAIDDSWFRDTGPIYVVSADGQRVALDWEFNGWGGKFAPWEDDATIARRWAEHAGHPTRTIPVVMEGGSLAVDGAGTLVTTAECLMHPNRNPGLTRRDLEAVLVSELGVSTIIWLPHGLALDRDTDGHVDNVAAFAAPARLVMQGCDDRSEADWARCNINARCASQALDARGEPIEVVELPVLPYTVVGGRRVAVPYLNYYVANGVVVVPVCHHPADAATLEIIAEQYPGRDIIGLDVGPVLASGGGGIHCITQQVPEVG
jgi:agmatine deiminase